MLQAMNLSASSEISAEELRPVLNIVFADRVDHRLVARLALLKRHIERFANGVTQIVWTVRIYQYRVLQMVTNSCCAARSFANA